MDIFVTILLMIGLIFFTGGGIGIIRFPDFYSRLHPAGKLDTMGSLLMMTGLAVFSAKDLSPETLLTGLKIILIVVFIFLSSPTAIHGIVDAGMKAGMEPWTKTKKKEEL